MSRRLMEMGLLPGTRVEAIRRAPLGDPLKIRLRGYLLSLRLADAAEISLAPEATADMAPPDASAASAFHFPANSMRDASETTKVPTVLVAGNANSGKTTVFNALTGARAQVGNYPGVTVTRSSRRVTLPAGTKADIVDLPGTYSLTAHSPDEQVAVDAVLGRYADPPDAVVVVIDAGALERGLYLAVQIIETGVPAIVALNMLDEAEASGADFDTSRLEGWLGATVVPTVASKGVGLDVLRDAVAGALRKAPRSEIVWSGFSKKVETELKTVERVLADSGLATTPAATRSWAVWSLLSLEPNDTGGSGLPLSVHQAVLSVRDKATETEWRLDQEIVGARYLWIERVVKDVRSVVREDTRAWTNRLDAILTHRVSGMLVFAVVMAVLFEALFAWSEPLIGLIEGLTATLQGGVAALLPPVRCVVSWLTASSPAWGMSWSSCRR